MSFQENLIRARKARGMTQEELAARLSISRQAVSKWETDASIPELDKLLRLAELFGVTLDELVKGESAQPEAARGEVPDKESGAPASRLLCAARYPQRLSRGMLPREKPLRRRSGGSQSRTDLCAAS